MNDQANYTKAFVCLALSGLFLFFALFSLPTIILSPQKFTSLFTIAMLCLILALAFLNGPATYVKKATEQKNLVATLVLFGSIVASLYFSIVQGAYLLSIFFCFLEVIFNLFKCKYSLTQCYCSFAIRFQRGRQEWGCLEERQRQCLVLLLSDLNY